MLDEAQAWATIAVGGRVAVTTETTTRFRRPVLVGEMYQVEAGLTAQDDATIATTAAITDARGKVCAETTASFAVLGPAQAARATGADEASLDASYLRSDAGDEPEP